MTSSPDSRFQTQQLARGEKKRVTGSTLTSSLTQNMPFIYLYPKNSVSQGRFYMTSTCGSALWRSPSCNGLSYPSA